MTKSEFLRVVSCFLQDPDAIVSDRGQVVFENGDAEYSIGLKMLDGEVSEILDKDGRRYGPIDWISSRLAHIEYLAQAILRQFQASVASDKYVPVESTYHDLELGRVEVRDTECDLYKRLEQADSLQTSVYFLTSEAGEGKTMIMRRLAVKSATRFLGGEQNWIFVPVELGGKPFFRLDEFILGSLNRFYRYSLYLDAFTELVKKGRIVLGLDGFEESAVQGVNGDVISSLGSLLSSLSSQGCVVFASRKAFFFRSHLHDYKTFSRLAQSHDVSINEFRVKPWGEMQVVALAEKYGLARSGADAFYAHLANALGTNCPLLTRAVLAHKFISELVCANPDCSTSTMDEIIGRFRGKATEVLIHQFLSYLLERETGKLVRSDTDVTPVLDKVGHERILRNMAEEMWNTDIESLSLDTVDAIVELEVEKDRLSPDELSRCRAHIPHHAFLSVFNDKDIMFCHLDFYHYFLGGAIAEMTFAGDDLAFELHKALNRKPLPVITLKECARRLALKWSYKEIQERLSQMNTPSNGGTPLGQNIAALLLLAHQTSEIPVELVNMYCPEFVLQTKYLNNVTLRQCVIGQCDLTFLTKSNVVFVDCEFLRAVYIEPVSLYGVTFDVGSLPHVLVRSQSGEKPDVGERHVVAALIRRAGANVLQKEKYDDVFEFEEDECTQVFFKVVLAFDSTTVIAENLLKIRLGTRYALFKNKICDLMLMKKVLIEKPSRGRDAQRMFRLSMPSEQIAKARVVARGCFGRLIDSL